MQRITNNKRLDSEGQGGAPKRPPLTTIKSQQEELMEGDEGEFQEVKRRKSNKRKGVIETEIRENLKTKLPDKRFIVEVKRDGAENTKKALWTEVLKRVNVPQIKNTRMLPRGDLAVKPGDEKTYQALKDFEAH